MRCFNTQPTVRDHVEAHHQYDRENTEKTPTGFMAVVLHADRMVVEAYGLDAGTPLYTATVPLTMTADGY